MGEQELTADAVAHYIEASPDALCDFIADVTARPSARPTSSA